MTLKVVTSGTASGAVAEFVPVLIADKVASRIAAKDFTLWGKDAESESSIRLGWVNSAEDSAPLVESILALRDEFAAKGVTRFVLCGMGGSSLAPEVITRTAGVELVVLDSTDADQVGDALAGDLSKTAIVVSSKSGSTVETDSQKRIFERHLPTPESTRPTALLLSPTRAHRWRQRPRPTATASSTPTQT